MSVKLSCIVHYEDIGWYAIATKPYRLDVMSFLDDRRAIPEKWAIGAINAWKVLRLKNWVSAPFDGVYDFNLLEDNGKPRRG